MLYEVITDYPEAVEAYQLLGETLVEDGKPEEAIPLFEQALALEQDNIDLRNNFV